MKRGLGNCNSMNGWKILFPLIKMNYNKFLFLTVRRFFNATDLKPETEYKIYVKADNSEGTSKASNTLSVTTEKKPYNPNDTVLSDVGINEVNKKLKWTASTLDEQLCVKVETKTESDKQWKVR